jgi:SAM-dependent methyltransferase
MNGGRFDYVRKVERDHCAACGGSSLAPHLRVSGSATERDFAPATDRFGIALSDIVRCRRCGHMQLDRIPSDAEVARAYAALASNDHLDQEAGQRATARRTLDQIERHVPRGALLDLGAWVGFLLAEARNRGWEGVGIEPSQSATRYARERLGLDVRQGDLFSVDLAAQRFQAVALGDVLEHVPQPRATLHRIAELLVPGGVLWLALPDAGSTLARALGRRWWSIIPPHLHYFTRASVRTLLQREGYEVREIGTAPKTFTVRYYAQRVAGYSPPLARALIRGAELTRSADRLLAPDFRDRMAVVARQIG